MLAASMDNDSFDEEEGDTVYKERYDRLRREAEKGGKGYEVQTKKYYRVDVT
jgi:hypothetical protein